MKSIESLIRFTYLSNLMWRKGWEGKISPGFERYKWFISKLPPPPVKVLEIGFNSGEALSYINDLGYECTGIDLSFIVQKYGKNPKIKYIERNMDNPNAYDLAQLFHEEFDIVILGEVLQHIIFDTNLLYAIWFYLKPNGLLLMSTENCNLVNQAIRYYPTDILKTMLEILSFKIEDLKIDGQKYYIWISARKIGKEIQI